MPNDPSWATGRNLLRLTARDVALFYASNGRSPAGGRCLYYAHYLAEHLLRLGVMPRIAAGALSWQQPDNTCFQQPWIVEPALFADPESTPEAAASLLQRAQHGDLLVSMHVWVCCSKAVLDASAIEFPRLYRRSFGKPWPGEKPCRLIYTMAESKQAVYSEKPLATAFANLLLAQLFDPAYLKPGQHETLCEYTGANSGTKQDQATNRNPCAAV